MKEDEEMVMHRKAVLWVATIAIAAGILTACSSSGDDGPALVDQPTSTPVPASNGAPSPSFGALEPGKYVFRSFDDDFDASYRITMDLLDGYEGVDGEPVVGSDEGQGISAWIVGNVYAKPCHWVGTLIDPPVGSSVDGLVAALASQQQRHASRPTDVELDGFTGRFMEMTVPAGIDLADCHEGQFRTWVDSTMVGARNLEPGQHDLLWIVDVDGRRLVIDAALGVGTSAQDRADRIQMVESIRIEPL